MPRTPTRWTDIAVKAFRPRDIRYEEKCPGLPGLRLEIMPSGSRSFIVRYTFAGTYKRLTLGSYPKCTLAKAHELYTEAMGALMSGRDPATDFKRKRSGEVAADDTVTAYAELFKRQRFPKLAEGSRYYYRLELDKLTDKYGNRAMRADGPNRITVADVQKHIDDAVDRGLGAQRTCWKVVRGFFNWASPRAGIENPCADIAAPSEDTERKRFLADDEIKIAWKAADASTSQPAGALVKLLLLTGCRRSEICYLTRPQLKASYIVFPESLTKNGEPHGVPRTWLIDRVLADLPKSGLHVLTGQEKGLGGHTKARAAIKTPDIKEWTFHDLRRSFASGLARLGVPIQVTELCLNHKSGLRNKPLVRIYQQHDYEDEVQAAFEKWTDHVAALVGEKRDDKQAAA